MPDGKLVVSCLGDSITAGTPLWDPDPAVRAEIGEGLDEKGSWPYWAEQTTGAHFRNHGVDREQTAQIAARLDRAAQGAGVLVVQGGVNDLVHGDGLVTAVPNLRAMILRGCELGLRVAIVELVPNDNFPELHAPIAELNERIRELGSEVGVPVLPFHATLEDPSRRGYFAAGFTDDGNHPSVEGHRQLGEVAFRLP
jgi:lysophospholipase L1-like esterase